MAEFWIFSNFLREKCEENIETHKLCKQIAAKYMEGEKKEFRAQNAREENILLKLDVGNLESLSYTVIENAESQIELQLLLTDYYKEHLAVTFDINESEIEKLYSYDEIKIELETRESANVYQQVYWRKLKLAKKMEERQIVKKYRQKEQEFLKTQEERLNLEESLRKLKEKADENRARVQQLHECIYRLVKGSKDLEIFYSQYPLIYGSQKEYPNPSNNGQPFGSVHSTKPSEKMLHRRGLSSRLLSDYNLFETPSVPALPKIRTINSTNGLSRLLQQAEVLRKSMQRSVSLMPDDPPTPKLLSILKTSVEHQKIPESTQKTVSFEMITSGESNPDINQITLDTTVSEIAIDSEQKKNLFKHTNAEAEKPNIIILENILLKPPEKILPVQLAREQHSEPLTDVALKKKRQIIHDDHNYTDLESPPKRKRDNTDNSVISTEVGSKTFADIFLEFSNETPTTSLSLTEPTKNAIENVQTETNESTNKFKYEKKEIQSYGKNDSKPDASYDDFAEFFSGFAGSDNSDNNDNDQSAAEMSFDFFEGKEVDVDGDAGSDNFSFKF